MLNGSIAKELSLYMPRYFFHIRNGTQDIDRSGNEFPDPSTARREAVRYGGALLRDDPDLLVRDDDLRVTVTDEDGALSCAIIILAVDGIFQKS